MPLPDAKPDKRIYELLKTVDLENLTFADFQGVAKTIYAEQGAEDELRRIVLVNLARLAVKGNWEGLLTSGGSGSAIPSGAGDMGSTFDTIMASGGLFGGNTMSSSTFNWSDSKVYFVPIVFPKDLTITGIQYSVTSGSFTGRLGLYSANTNGSPSTLEVESGLQSGVTSGYYSAGVVDTDVTGGTLYWIGIAQGTTPTSVTIRAMKNDAQGGNYVYITSISNFNALQLRTSVQVGTDSGLPSSITTSELESLYGLHPMLGVGF